MSQHWDALHDVALPEIDLEKNNMAGISPSFLQSLCRVKYFYTQKIQEKIAVGCVSVFVCVFKVVLYVRSFLSSGIIPVLSPSYVEFPMHDFIM